MTARLMYHGGGEWHDLGPMEAVDTDSVILESPRMFRAYPVDVAEAWRSLDAGMFGGRFFAVGADGDGHGLAREFWFEGADWGVSGGELRLRCENVRRGAEVRGFHVPGGKLSNVAVPEDWSSYHHEECGTMYRGCSPDCPKDIYESTGKWVGERMMRERLAMLEEDASELRACLGESGWPIPDA